MPKASAAKKQTTERFPKCEVYAEPLPKETLCRPVDRHEDSRGAITTLVRARIGAVQVITSKKGTVRAEHAHKSTYHWCHVVSGKLRYLERPLGSDELPKELTVGPGVTFFTPPQVEHSMEFLEDTVFLNITPTGREQESYEDDLIRLMVPLHKVLPQTVNHVP